MNETGKNEGVKMDIFLLIRTVKLVIGFIIILMVLSTSGEVVY